MADCVINAVTKLGLKAKLIWMYWSAVFFCVVILSRKRQVKVKSQGGMMMMSRRAHDHKADGGDKYGNEPGFHSKDHRRDHDLDSVHLDT